MATNSRTRPSAIVRAEHGGEAVQLSKDEQHVLQEALRLGEDLSDQMESAVSSYGRWLLENVFNDNVSAALDLSTKNKLWAELVRRAGGPTLHVSRRMLYVALQVAAYDRRIRDQAWRGLDTGRKELLLPLGEDKLREGAQHVSKFDLSQSKTREYVAEMRMQEGRSKQPRVTSASLKGRVKKLRDALGGASVLRKVRSLGGKLDDAERDVIVHEIDSLRSVLEELTKALKG
jgi:hypothetical protein